MPIEQGAANLENDGKEDWQRERIYRELDFKIRDKDGNINQI